VPAKQRGETSSATVTAMTPRRLIRSSSQHKDDELVALRAVTNAASQMRCRAQDGYGSRATKLLLSTTSPLTLIADIPTFSLPFPVCPGKQTC
jgi:hypothetical protein